MTTCYLLIAGALQDLRRDTGALVRRLEATAWPEPPDAGDWTHGVPAAVARRCARDWARWLAQPEQAPPGHRDVVPTATTAVPAVRFSGSGQLPLLLLHGWPTSFLAVRPVIEPLRKVASKLTLGTLPGLAAGFVSNLRQSA